MEGLLGQADGFLGAGELLGTERGTVGFFRAGLGGRAAGDDRAALDQGRALGLPAGGLEGLGDGRRVVAVDVQDVPAVGLEALADVLGEGEVGGAVDGDRVVVVEIDQLAEAEVTGEGGRLGGDAFHEVAVADDAVREVVDDVVPVAVVAGGEERLGDRHPDTRCEAAAEGTGGDLDARGVIDLGVSGRLAVELPEGLQLGHRQVVAGEVQQGVEQHRAVAGGEHEAIAVGPARLRGIVAQEPEPQRRSHLGGPHGHAGVSGVGLLDAVHREALDGVGNRLKGGGVDRTGWQRSARHRGLRNTPCQRGLRWA